MHGNVWSSMKKRNGFAICLGKIRILCVLPTQDFSEDGSMHMKRFAPYPTRWICHCFVLSMLILIFAGCSSQQPVSRQQANAQPVTQKSSMELNPLKWPWNPLEWDTYNFREKYNFKVGNMWVIKPPREFNPAQIVIVRELGKIPAQPQTQAALSEIYAEYAQNKEVALATAKLTQAKTQMLVIDVISSDALLRDSDGTEYPSQVDPALTRRLVDLTTDRKWLAQKKTKAKKIGGDEWAYRSVFQESSDEYKPVRRQWKVSEVTNNSHITEVQHLLTR